MTKLLPLLLLAVVLAAPVGAETWDPDDFAYGIPVSPAGEAPVVQVTVPEDIYRFVVRSDLGDLRVFNRQGDQVPHMLRRVPDQMPSAGLRRSLPLFPLPDRQDPPKDYRVWVQTDSRGAIVEVRHSGSATSGNRRSQAYIVDVSGWERPLARLSLSWPKGGGEFIAALTVAASDDLVHWQDRLAQATLADLEYQGQHLKRDTVALPPRLARYLRLAWQGSEAPVIITDVVGEAGPEKRPPDHVRLHLSASGGKGQKGVFEYDAVGRFPVEEIRLAFDLANTLVRATVSSRPDAKSPWRMRGRGVFYTLSLRGTQFESDPLRMPAVSDRLWQVALDPDLGSVGLVPPVLLMDYRPMQILFLAQGDPPFTIAFGSAVVPPNSANFDSLFAAVSRDAQPDLIRTATVGERMVLGGENRLARSWRTLDWKAWSLWAVMIAGVLTIGAMAWRLYTKINAEHRG